jgi:hypothetical protein
MSSIAKNSAPSKTNNPADDRKANINHKTECTGFLLMTVISPPVIALKENK